MSTSIRSNTQSILALCAVVVAMAFALMTGSPAQAAKPDPGSKKPPVAAACDVDTVTLYEGTISRKGAVPPDGEFATVSVDASSNRLVITPDENYTATVVKVRGGADLVPDADNSVPNPWVRGKAVGIAVCGEFIPPVDPPASGFSVSFECAPLDSPEFNTQFSWAFTADEEVATDVIVHYLNSTNPVLNENRGESLDAASPGLTMFFQANVGDVVSFDVSVNGDVVPEYHWEATVTAGMTCSL